MEGLGGEALQPPEAEIFQKRNNPPPWIRDFLKVVGGGFIPHSKVSDIKLSAYDITENFAVIGFALSTHRHIGIVSQISVG